MQCMGSARWLRTRAFTRVRLAFPANVPSHKRSMTSPGL